METRRTELPELMRLALYGPRYRIAESARFAQVPPQTLSRWFNGAIPAHPDRRRKGRVSYMQLVEAAFVGTFRSLGAPLPRVRQMRDSLAEAFGAEFPFGVVEFKTHGLEVAIDLCTYDRSLSGLTVTDHSSKVGWHPCVVDRIEQCDYDKQYGVALRWYLRGRSVPILIDPRISSGAPIVRSGIATWALAGRFGAGERKESILSDFRHVSADEFAAALEFEEALQTAA